MPGETLRLLVSRHSAFYTPVIAAIAGGFLKAEGFEATYAVLPKGRRARDMIRAGEVDVVQSAVSSNWGPMELGETDLPVHFALINRRDGFFLVGRRAEAVFDWRKLEDAALLADHGGQPLAMLKYAAHRRGVEWGQVQAIDAGTPDEMEAAFRAGRGDFVHLQGPAPQQLEKDGAGHVVAAVGKAIPPVAFSTLMASRQFLETGRARAFMRAYRRAREWATRTPAGAIGQTIGGFFPGVDPGVLGAAARGYQELGCWQGDPAITRELYEMALEVFLDSGAVGRRHGYEAVVVAPPE